MSRTLFVAVFVVGCAVDPSGIPGRSDGSMASDLSVPDGPVTPDLGRDQGMPEDLGPEADMGEPPDMAMMMDDLGIDMGPPDLGPPDMGPPDMGPPDMFVPMPDMFVPDGGCGMAETCNGADDDCDGAIDENPGAGRGENVCPSCTREVSPGGITYQVCSEDTRRWSAARDACRAVGYELASLDSMAEDSFVDSVLIGGEDYWIGANDRGTEGTFTWIDGTPFGAFTDWASGEPNNTGGGFDDADCVRISRDDSNTWRDDDCGGTFQAEYRYVCEAP